MTIAQIIAAKKAAAGQVALAAPQADPMLDAAINRIDPPSVGKRRGLVLSASAPLPAADVAEKAHYSEARKLSLPLSTPPPPAEAWGTVLGCTERDLCLMRDPTDPETCWLAVRHQECDHAPILIMRLPWLLWEHPTAIRPEDIPY